MQLLLSNIVGLGNKSAEKLKHLGIYSANNLLLHLPYRYQDKTQFKNLGNCNIGDEVLLRLKIDKTTTISSGKSQLICHLSDENNNKLVWRFFNFGFYQKQQFIRGASVDCFGEIKFFNNSMEMLHPEYRIISQNQSTLLCENLTPIYHLVAGIFQKKLQKWIAQVLYDFQQTAVDSHFKAAILLLHNPPKNSNIVAIKNYQHSAQLDLIVEELAVRKLAMLHARNIVKKQTAIKLFDNCDLAKQLKLNFVLTNSQQKVIKEISKDMNSDSPMLRLLQGDVGSGKTIVAIITTLNAIANNQQAAIMAPTTILAEQHFLSFTQHLAPLKIKIAFLSSSQNSQTRRQQLYDIKHDAQIIIGTHSIFQDEVEFKNLAYIIIDEQHKFGVEQRLSLSKKSKFTPHQLIMTATPIPRSIVMSAYGEMDVSVINELPKNRQTIDTIAINSNNKNQLLKKIQQNIISGEQIYWVCTLIEDSNNFNAMPIVRSYEFLLNNLPNAKIAMVHSKIEKLEKQQIMKNYADGKIDILVATTVIEVGVDVPNATLMIIENTEKLGLSQLHQLRGRVGRSHQKSMCILMYKSPLSPTAKKRIDILRKTNDGFKIAQKDLELRGHGEILGTNQTGIINMKIADIVRDEYLMKDANKLALKFFKMNFDKQQFLINRWINDNQQQYINT